MNEKIFDIAKKLFESHGEILDPTILKNVEVENMIRELGYVENFKEEEIILIKIKWANIVFNSSSLL
jgi:Fe-S-cluster formation regulator IscX/YfhJ